MSKDDLRRKLKSTVRNFSAEMEKKVLAKLDEGYSGWDDFHYKEYLMKELLRHSMKGDYVDVANIAMFLWNLEN